MDKLLLGFFKERSLFLSNLIANTDVLTPTRLLKLQDTLYKPFIGKSAEEIKTITTPYTHFEGEDWTTSFLCFLLNVGVSNTLNSFSQGFANILPIEGRFKLFKKWAIENKLTKHEPKVGDIVLLSDKIGFVVSFTETTIIILTDVDGVFERTTLRMKTLFTHLKFVDTYQLYDNLIMRAQIFYKNLMGISSNET